MKQKHNLPNLWDETETMLTGKFITINILKKRKLKT
jgi:hypothetical protein